jgi:RNA recognition motif-containing protein
MNIYVGNLPYSTDDQELKAIFGTFGEVVGARVIFDRDTGRSKGYGFVEMTNDEDGKRALSELNGCTVGGRTLRVNEALPRTAGSGGAGGYRD